MTSHATSSSSSRFTEPLDQGSAAAEKFVRAATMGTRLASGQMVAKVGQTPRRAIWSLNKSTLYRYEPKLPKEQRHGTPLLMIFALINRPYILDLRPGYSFVEFMLEAGYDVYLFDWGTPGPEDQDQDFGYYVLDLLPRAVRRLQAFTGRRDFSLLGWCIGATLATIYAATRPNDGLKNLVLLTAPLDFSNKNAGPFNIWLDERFFNVDGLVNALGNMPGEMIDYGNKMLKPVENFVGSYVKLLDNLDDENAVEAWHAMNTWVSDLTPFTGAAFRQWVVDFYREDRLMQGTLVLRGERVDVSNITAATLNVIAEQDHIVPPCQSETLLDRISSADKQLARLRGGHIGIMAGSNARKRAWPAIDAFLGPRSD